MFEHTTRLRVRYSETDRLGTFYNARALEWFEVGRTECLRAMNLPYAEMESRGCFLPLVQAHVDFTGRATYDDELVIRTRVSLEGKARIRFDMTITQAADGAPVTNGHTLHACTTAAGKPTRPPAWLVEALNDER